MKQSSFAAAAFAFVVTAGILTVSCSQPAQQPAAQSAPAEARAGGPSAAPGAAAPPPAPAEAPAPPRAFTLAAGTTIQVETTSTISTKTNKTGEPIAATLVNPIVDGDWVIAAKGAPVSGVIVSADQGGRVSGRASLVIKLTTLTLADGQTVPVATSSHTVTAKSSTKKDVTKVGIAAGAGTVVGAIAGGGKGAAIGAAVGGGAGTAAVLSTHGNAAAIEAATAVSFTLTQPITVTRKQ
jgi:hypothetical protein